MTELATRFANYKGDWNPIGQMVGPTHRSGLYYVAVSRVYDAETNMTRVGFAVNARRG